MDEQQRLRLGQRMLTHVKQFFLLLWKNYTLQKRSLIGTCLEIAVPALFAIILMPIRRIVNSTPYPDDIVYNSYDLNQFPGGLAPKLSLPSSLFNRPFQAEAPSPFWCFGYQPADSALVQT